VIEKQIEAISAEKDSLAERIVSLEKARSTVAKTEKPKTASKATAAAPARPKATPVAAKAPGTKRTR
jgi:hypothetical protein